jgi:HD superfamily phosphodiesterase
MNEQELQLLIKKYRVPKRIMAHMKKVAEVAVFIGEKIARNGGKVDITKLRQAALLHDIVKICDFRDFSVVEEIEEFSDKDMEFWKSLYKSCHAAGHIETACKILKDINEPVLAEIIRKHRYNCVIDPDRTERPSTWEEKILLYADKRVAEDKIVSLKERLEDGRRRYLGNEKRPYDVEVEIALLKLEKEICDAAHIRPEDI